MCVACINKIIKGKWRILVCVLTENIVEVKGVGRRPGVVEVGINGDSPTAEVSDHMDGTRHGGTMHEKRRKE